jgi:2',3'-cyclic-nucleotide 2'-phosphodiesterase (5'-nucleotidase family)
VVINEGGLADANIDRIVMGWQGEAEAELNVVIGYTDQEIAHQSQELQDMVVDAWLFNYPADVAITNLGGLRAPIPPGEITLGDIVGVMPFDNTIIEVQLTGADLLKTIIEGGRPVIGGMQWTGQAWVLTATGEPIEADAEYSVLVNSFMYAGGDGYDIFAQADPDAYDTGIQYRQPLIDWIIDQQSNPSKPLLSGQ